MMGPDSNTAGAKDSRKLVVYINSSVVGRGDDGLGVALMAAFMESLFHFAVEIRQIIFINSGVKLVAADSPVLGHLRELEQMGAKIYSCTTCLKFYNMLDTFGVGNRTDMVSIVDMLSQADSVISP